MVTHVLQRISISRKTVQLAGLLVSDKQPVNQSRHRNQSSDRKSVDGDPIGMASGELLVHGTPSQLIRPISSPRRGQVVP